MTMYHGGRIWCHEKKKTPKLMYEVNKPLFLPIPLMNGAKFTTKKLDFGEKEHKLLNQHGWPPLTLLMERSLTKQ